MAANTQNFRVKYGLDVTETANVGSTLGVTGVATFSNNVVIQGTLQVVNSVSFSTTVDLGTSEIVLLKDVAGAPSLDAQLTVNRGTSADVNIRWDETLDQWRFTNDGTLFFPLRTYADVTYQFSTTTATDTDPSGGKFRLNNATPASVTEIAISDTEFSTTNVSAFINAFDDSNSAAPKGYLLLRSSKNVGRFIVYSITLVTPQTGYRQIAVTHVSGSTLFDNDDVIFISFSRTGEKGQKGERVSSAAFTDATNTTLFTNSDSSTFSISGLKGQKGERINSAAFTDLTNTTLFTNSDSSTFSITGLKGQKGEKGERVSGASYDGAETTTFTNSDSSTFTVTGLKGQKGQKGEIGDKGDKGELGYTGVGIGSAVFWDANNTLQFNKTDLTATYVNGVKGQKGEIGEKGQKGEVGQKGERVSSASYNDGANSLTFTNSDATTFSITGIKGQKGEGGLKGGDGVSVKGDKGSEGGFTTNSNAQVNSLGVGQGASATTGRIDTLYIYSYAFFYTSNKHLKYDIAGVENSLELIKKLNPVDFKWKKDNTADTGFIAQEVLEWMPRAVTNNGDDIAIKYNVIVAHLTKAVQELSGQVEVLTKKLEGIG